MKLPPLTERDFAISVVKRLQESGHQALWAGGCVRDELLGLVPKDYDIATDARPEQVQHLFPRTIGVGASFGVVEVLGPRRQGEVLKVQVATFRTDGAYVDGRRPEEVHYSSPREDALRRDFTINGMFYDPILGQLHDYIGGQQDLHARILRAIGEPALRFQEDKLRLLRAVRIATRFELAIEPKTETAIKSMAKELPVVSAERIAEELRQLLVHPRRSRGLNLLLDLKLVDAILPELLPLHGELWEHVMNVMDLIDPDPSFPLAMGTLLHHVDARLAEEIAQRLKLSNTERERIVWLVEKHQYLANVRQMRLCKLKVILNHDGIRELLSLHRADALATGKNIDHVEYCEQLLRTWTPQELNPPPFINGYDLMELGVKPSPLFKQVLDQVREAQLDGAIHTSEEALVLARRLIQDAKGPR
jgi:poly(A) polymerase